ncbi:hypothetical protein ABW19_dt0203943 [Dactylella cylindrospora]|nr:hypothetical protein ABW19_dt0203943 [Dactylella cylindrospora]
MLYPQTRLHSYLLRRDENGTPEPRRSGRSTKGQHTRNAELNEEQPAAKKTAPVLKKGSKPTRGKGSKADKASSPAATATTEENSDDGEIIRCVCGADTDEGGRQMIQCDRCNAWQHSSCMQIPTKNTPEEYYCEQCKPELHKDLLEKMARGEKPWERRGGRKGGRKSTSGSKKRKGGSEAPEGTPATEGQPDEDQRTDDKEDDVKMESPAPTTVAEPEKEEAPVEEDVPEGSVDNMANEPEEPAPEPEEKADVAMKEEEEEAVEEAFEKPAPPNEASRRRSSIASTNAGVKRKADESVEEEGVDTKDQSSPTRKASIPQSPTQTKGSKTRSGRRSSTTAATAKPPPTKKPKTTENQLEQVGSIDEIKSDTRRKGAETLKKFLEGALKPVEKLPEGETSKTEFAARLALEIEHYTYILLSAQTAGEPNDEYRMKFRSILFNLKKNEPLLKNVLTKRIGTKEFSDMTGDEMATEDMKHIVQEAEKESEKQSILTAEASGPRIRRTHKGEEVVGEDTGMIAENSTGFIGSRYEPPPEKSDDEGSAPPSPGGEDAVMADHPRSPSPKAQDPVETPSKALKIDTSSKPPSSGHHRRTSSFDIQSVWSNVESTDVEKGHRQSISRPPITPLTAHPANGNTQLDRDIDMLLQNDGASAGSETPPYSPKDYTEDDEDVIWKGKVLMRGVADLEAQAKYVAGPDLSAKVGWPIVIGESIEVTGRISVDRAKDYLCQLKYSSRSSDFVVFTLHPSARASGTLGQSGYDKLYAHFKGRQRSGVVGKPTWSPTKDVYVVAVGKDEPMPDYMIDSQFPPHPRDKDLLLLCIVFNRSLEPFQDNHTPTTATAYTPVPPSRTAQTPVTAVAGPSQYPQQGGWPQPAGQGYQQSPTPSNYYQGASPSLDQQYQPHPATFPASVGGAKGTNIHDLIRQLNLAPTDQAYLEGIIEKNPEAANNPQLLFQLVQQESSRRG